MLTKGPFALFYGGDKIIPDLSEGLPDSALPLLVVWSAIVQISLYILKSLKTRNLKSYAHNLTKSLVENVLNMYGIIVIILISITSVAYGLFHLLSIKKNKKQEKMTKLIPNEIIIMFSLTMFCVILPFIKSYALRYLL